MTASKRSTRAWRAAPSGSPRTLHSRAETMLDFVLAFEAAMLSIVFGGLWMFVVIETEPSQSGRDV